ncbi:MAG: DNA-binding transcriptional regulator [Planctomycetia bacterium]|nr:DNA-binding transcriptional regulator [Planctomycetia bacterium]
MARRTRAQRIVDNRAAPPRRIALLLQLKDKWGREQFCGIGRFAWPANRWIIRSGVPDMANLAEALDWKPDGIIMQVTSPAMIPPLQQSGIPVVNVSSRLASHPFAQAEMDYLAIGRMAAEHFLAKGFRNYGYFGNSESHGSRLREEGFRQRLAEDGCALSVLTMERDEGVYRHWRMAQTSLMPWVQSLPRPVAVFSFDDAYAVLVSHACLESGLAVPEQVALLGVENDEVFCHHNFPPLSSIQTAQEQVGYQAARLLERMMSGRAIKSPISLPPVSVVERASTSILAIEDPDVAMAVRFINDNATRRINVADVVEAVPLSRCLLERRFRRTLKRTILDEIQRVRVERTKHMLVTTRDSVPSIARAMGFRDGIHLWAVFRKLTGVSPDAFRRAGDQPSAPQPAPPPAAVPAALAAPRPAD